MSAVGMIAFAPSVSRCNYERGMSEGEEASSSFAPTSQPFVMLLLAHTQSLTAHPSQKPSCVSTVMLETSLSIVIRQAVLHHDIKPCEPG